MRRDDYTPVVNQGDLETRKDDDGNEICADCEVELDYQQTEIRCPECDSVQPL